jgi:O-antigen ligase
VILLGLLSTFSREGWLIVVLTCLAVAIPSRTASRIARPALATGLVMLVLFAAGITNVLGVNGRIDLTTSWYGPAAASVLLNPDPTTHGQAQTPSTTTNNPTPGVRTLLAPCVAVQASGTSSGPTVQLKGYSSLLARLCLWEAAARAIVHRPVFGFGPGTGTDAIVPFFYGQGAGLVGASTHDTYLRVGVEMGVPGLAIYLALSAIAVWLAIACLRAGRGPEVVLAASILAITVAELTDTLLFGGLSFPGFWLAMALGLLATRSAQEQPARATEHWAASQPLSTPHAVSP